MYLEFFEVLIVLVGESCSERRNGYGRSAVWWR